MLHNPLIKYGTSYKVWNDNFNNVVESDVKNIFETASKASEYGYLTKNKIEKLNRYRKLNELVELLGKQTIIIKGKAGTGKTSLLFDLLKSCEVIKRNTLLLTYNKLLVSDIAMNIRSFQNYNHTKGTGKSKEHSTQTLHGFFFRLSTNLGVLLLMSEKRCNELLSMLDSRLVIIEKELSKIVKFQVNDKNEDRLKEYFQNKIFMNEINENNGLVTEAINVINYLSKKLVKKEGIKKHCRVYRNEKEDIIKQSIGNERFLADYTGVLENIFSILVNPDDFFNKYDVEKKYDLLAVQMNLKEQYLDEKNELDLDKYKSRLKKGYNGTKRARIVFVDEGQDCHILEKKIIYSLFGIENIVVSTGGEEQLIRHHEVRDWSRDQDSKPINHKLINKRNKSFRLKKNLATLCNYIAKHYNINLNLEHQESEDDGSVIIDLRKDDSQSKVAEFEGFITKGKISGCKEYESLMILREPILSKNKKGQDNPGIVKNRMKVTQYGNIEEDNIFKRTKWNLKEKLENQLGLMFWDKIEDDVSKITAGYSLTRILNYESCRGLEAWTVSCFNIDDFFERKMNEDNAEKFLVQQDAFETNEDRKRRYAATWVLMAITRAIDTLHLNINDANSEFGKLIAEYCNNHPNSGILRK